MSGASALQGLPREIIIIILKFVEQPSPIQQGLYGNAAKILNDDTETGAQPTTLPAPPPPRPSANTGSGLKTASLLCRSWRDPAWCVLFSHVLWKFQSLRRPAPGRGQDYVLAHLRELEWLRFLRRNDLTRRVKSLTIAITYPECEIGEDATHHGRFGILPSHDKMATRNRPPTTPKQDNNWLWRIIFDHIDPRTINLISSPAILASLLGRPIDLSGAWLFSQRFHILSLSRLPSSKVIKVPLQEQASAPGQPSSLDNVPCDLFSIRDWNSLFINEGSSVRAYATYEYFSHTPPSLLPALFDSSDPSMFKLLRSLVSLSYVAIFPFSSHIVENLIQRIPSLDRFFIQIGPQDLNLAEEPYRRPSIDINDFWFERHSAYQQLTRAIFDSNPIGLWKDLQVFEYGDSEDMESWETAVRHVVFQADTKWKVSGNGVITRTEHTPSRSSTSPFGLYVLAMLGGPN